MELLVLINRYSQLLISFAATVAFTLFLPHLWAILMIIISGGLALTGVMDLAQPEHSVRRNYPLVGRLRWIFESVRPAIRQYLVEGDRSEEHTSELQSLMRISYAVFCLNKKKQNKSTKQIHYHL